MRGELGIEPLRVGADELAAQRGGQVVETRLTFVAGAMLAAAAFPFGLFVGWLIWG